MQFARRVVLAFALLTFATGTAWSAGKTTLDPNSVPKTEAVPVEVKDSRLDQKIEYDATNRRLHDVIADLAKMSGVTISCGISPKDWPVRDIPMTIASRGLTLDKLLHTIADATLTGVKASRNSKGVLTYAVYRDSKTQKMIDDYLKSRTDYQRAFINRSWKQACKLKDIPEDKVMPDDPKHADPTSPGWKAQLACSRAMSALLSEIDADTQARIISGEVMTFSARTAPAALRPLIMGVLEADNTCMKMEAEYYGDDIPKAQRPRPATPEELQDSTVTFSLDVRNGNEINISTMFRNFEADPATNSLSGSYGARPYFRRGGFTNLCTVSSLYRLPGKFEPGPKQPENNPFWLAVAGYDRGYGEEPEFAKTIEVKFADDKQPKRWADAVVALSKASGISFVCQDFWSHKDRFDLRGSFDRPGRLIDKIERGDLAGAMNGDLSYLFWRADKDRKVLLGEPLYWDVEYANLVPESTLEGLIAKAKGKGLQFDDMLSLATLTWDQIDEWILKDRSLTCVSVALGFLRPAGDRRIWALVSSLSADEMALARSESGLRLDGFDSKALRQILNARKNSRENVERVLAGEQFTEDRLTDSAVLPSLVLRIKENTMGFVRYGGGAGVDDNWNDSCARSTPPMIKKQRTVLVIEGNDGGQKVCLEINGPSCIPFCTEERDKALASTPAK